MHESGPNWVLPWKALGVEEVSGSGYARNQVALIPEGHHLHEVRPSNPSVGTVVFDFPRRQLFVYTDDGWVEVVEGPLVRQPKLPGFDG